MPAHTPHPANVPGDFYVEEGCCTLFGVPWDVAPDLFGVAENPTDHLSHCYVRRQPRTPAELDGMVEAFQCAELQCIRDRCTDRPIQERLIQIGEGTICDALPPDLQHEADRQQAERERLWQDQRDQLPTQELAARRPPRPWWRFW